MLEPISINIDYSYVVDGNYEIDIDGESVSVSAGDIILKMYPITDSEYNKREIIVIKSDKLADYINRLIEFKNSKKIKYSEQDNIAADADQCTMTSCN